MQKAATATGCPAHLSAEAVSSIAPSGLKRSERHDSACALSAKRFSKGSAQLPVLYRSRCTRPVMSPVATSGSRGWKAQSCDGSTSYQTSDAIIEQVQYAGSEQRCTIGCAANSRAEVAEHDMLQACTGCAPQHAQQ